MLIKITTDFMGITTGTEVDAKAVTPAGALIPATDGVSFVPTGFFEAVDVIAPPPPVTQPEATVTTPPSPVTQPEATVTTPPSPVTQPEATVTTPPSPVTQPEATVTTPETTDEQEQSPKEVSCATQEQLENLDKYIEEFKAEQAKGGKKDAPKPATPKQAHVAKEEPKGTDVPNIPEPPKQAHKPAASEEEITTEPKGTPPEVISAINNVVSLEQSVSIKSLAYDFVESKVPDMGIPVYPDELLSDEERKLVPVINPHFKWSGELLFTLYWAVFHDANVLLTGMPGTGKTDAVEQFAALINRPYVSISGKGDLEGYQVIGQNYSEGGQMVWRDGTFTQGFRNGWIIGIHEVFKIPSTIMMNLQGAFERDGVLVLDDYPGEAADRIVTRHEKCAVISTDNTKGLGNDLHMFAAGQIQDTSFLDRMELVIDVEYLPARVEIQLLQDATGCTHVDASMMVQLARRIRSAAKDETVSLSMSLRPMLAALNMKVSTGIDLKHAVDLTMVNKYSDDEEVSVVQGFINTCIK